MTLPTIVGTSSASAASSTNWILGLPSTVQDGDIGIVCGYKENSAAVTNPSGQGYADADSDEQAVANGSNHWSYWFKVDLQAADASTNHTFTWTGGTWKQAFMIILRGTLAISSQPDTNPAAATVDTSSDTTAGATPADTSVSADVLALWFVNTFDSVSTTFPGTNNGNTVTERFDDGNNVHAASAPYPTAGTVSGFTVTLSSGSVDTCKTILIRTENPAAATTKVVSWIG